MKPGAFTMLAVLLAVLGVYGLVAGRVLYSRAIAAPQDVLMPFERGCAFADHAEAKLRTDRADLLQVIGVGVCTLAIMAYSIGQRSDPSAD